MKISFFNDELGCVDKKIVLLTVIGILETIKKGGVTIEEAEKFLFSPNMVRRLREKRCDEKIVNLIMKGCELEDVASLMPEKLSEIINEIEMEALELIKGYEEFSKSFWIEE